MEASENIGQQTGQSGQYTVAGEVSQQVRPLSETKLEISNDFEVGDEAGYSNENAAQDGYIEESGGQEGQLERASELRAIEAVLMVALEPIQPHLLAELLEVSIDRVEELCVKLQEEYANAQAGFEIVKIAGGYRFQSHPDMAEFVEKFALEGQTGRLTNAAMETLAIVAYKQPISRAQISSVRGVNVDSTVAMLVQRGYIAEIGRDPGPGRAVLYGTTDLFLEKLGLGSVADLPPLADFVPGPEVVERLEAGLRPTEVSLDSIEDSSADPETPMGDD